MILNDLTPLCPEYIRFYDAWIKVRTKKKLKSEAYEAMTKHRAACLQCRQRMSDLNELAKKAMIPKEHDKECASS